MTVVDDAGRYRELLEPLLDGVGELVAAVHAAVEDGGVLPGPDAPVLADIEAESRVRRTAWLRLPLTTLLCW